MRYIDVSPQANGLAKNRGQSSAAKHAYITRSGKYARHSDQATATGSVGMPAFAADDPAAYWSACDQFERANGTLAIEYVLPLPAGLTERQLVEFCERYAARVSKYCGSDCAYPVTWALHPGHGENPHMHMLVSERIVDDRSAALPPGKGDGEFFRRFDAERLDRCGAKKGNRLFESLDEIKRDYIAMANKWSERHGLDQRFVTGNLDSQRQQARTAIAAAYKTRDRAAWAAAVWWEAKTYRPVTSHRGQAAENGKSEGGAERLRKYRLERFQRDEFLEAAAAACEVGFIKKGVPVPDECAEYAARYHAKNPHEFPELNPGLAASLAQPAPPPAKPKPAPAMKPARQKQQEKNVEKIAEEMKPRRGEGVNQFIARRQRQSGTMPKKTGTIYATALQPADLERGRAFGSRYKLTLWNQIYKTEVSGFAAESIGYIFMDTRTIKTKSGVLVRDAGQSLEASKFDAQSIALMIEQASAKGWTDIEIEGGDEAVREEFRRAGFNVVGASPADKSETPVFAPTPAAMFDPLGLGAKRAANEERRRREIEEQTRRRAEAEKLESQRGPAI